MLGVIAFFLLLIVFSLAAQFVGYIEHLRAKSARQRQKEASEEWRWPSFQHLPSAAEPDRPSTGERLP